SDIKRYTGRVHVNAQPAEWLKTGLNISANYSESNLAQDTGSTSQANPFYFTRNMGPIYPVYAHNMTTGEYLLDPATGQKFYDLGNMGGAQGVPNRTLGAFAGRHALAETTLDEESILTTSISGRTYQEITFLKNFRFTNNLSADYQIQDYTSFDNPMVGDGAPLGQSRKVNASTSAFVASQLLSYGNTIDVHRFDGFIGHESFNQKNTNLNGFRQGQTIAGSAELGNFSTLSSSTSFVNRYKIESYFARVNYELDETYSASASVRRDGNSIFSPDARWGTFWSLSAGWNLSNEAFLSDIRWINLLRLRASYGVTGVSDGTGLPTSFGFYAYQGLYDYANNANEPGIAQSQTQSLNNPALKWETNNQLNIGLDFTLLRNRLNGSVDYFQRSSSDLIFAIPQPLSSGVLTVIQNTASVKNTGVELHLNGDIMRTKLFTWNMTLNMSTLNNKITEMPGATPEFVSGTKRYAEGKSIFEFWLPTYYGVDSADGTALYKAANTTTAANRRIKTNKSGGSDTLTTLASNALFEYYGTSIPDFYGSMGHSFTYKGFTLTGLFTFQIGGKTYDANYQSLMSSGTYGSALSSDIEQRWKAPGDNTSIPRVDAGRTTDFNASSSRWLIDASYLNIRMVSLAYNLPLSFISRWDLSTARFFVTGENLGFFSKRKGLNNQQDFGGVTSNAYPPATIISVGVTINR
ncbi:MAG TPA: TonB-dependent receptor, partial [Flavitalea sp.]|nr:TonB-dependent receptor [Flavitalea sp.]